MMSPLQTAFLTGFVSGLLLAIPVGPINLTILNEGARRGFAWALLIGLGASAMEVIYCALAFTGFSSFFADRGVKAAMEVFTFAFLLFLGVRFLFAKSVVAPIHLGAAAERLEERIEERLHPHSAFMIGFVRVLANPGVLVFWMILAANFVSRDWVEPTWSGKLACVSGVAASTSLWFLALSYGVSRGHGRLSEKTLLRMERISGAVLVALGLAHGVRLAWELARHKMGAG
jgi:threonine/homoserine/homoserine lactone efflux protein